MASKLIQDNVDLAFDILKDLDITKQIDFTLNASRDYNFGTGNTTVTEETVSLDGVIEYKALEGNDLNSALLEVPIAKAIIDKVRLNNLDYNLFDKFTADSIDYKIVDYLDNDYSVEFTGKKQ